MRTISGTNPEHAERTQTRTDASEHASNRRLRVLLVEDNPDLAAFTRLLLESWGYEVHAASRGSEALSIARTLPLDVALLDIGLPDIDGYALAETIRGELGPTRPKLVAVTGFGRREDKQRARAAGFDFHFVKPAPPDALRGLLAHLSL